MSTEMTRHEQIAAFLDGALEGADLAAFEAELEKDPTLADEVERMMGNDALLREAFEAPMSGKVDDALLARMGLLPAEDASAEIVDLDTIRAPAPTPANDNPPFLTRWALPMGGAVAAALAIAVFTGGPGGPTSFEQALDGTPSRQIAALDNGAELTPLLTFEAADGRFCREFAVSRSAASGGSGIACRTGDGWEVEVMEPGAAELADQGEYRLASGAEGAALDEAYARLGASDPFGPDREAELIEHGWSAQVK